MRDWLARQHNQPKRQRGLQGARLRIATMDCARVHLDRQGLHSERRLLGLMWRWQRVRAADIAFLSIKESHSTQSGNRHATCLRVQVNLRSRRRVTIADSLRGRPLAEQMLARVAKATGYPR